MSGWALLLAWIAFVAIAYVLALFFVVPDTHEALAVASVLFAWGGLVSAVFGYFIWRTR